eukprot:TRINITY_DN4678_c0_g1_i2.p1 TRINITY_DN4678_c0_g1~~TRINITY_DN4678_c0_g1_i2.p1  ORF type:complete len:451 (+),score=108.04 TRINITY_DN4678_c0_g1_i2:881-2233(+)
MFSTLEKGILTIDCPASKNPYYIVNPDFTQRTDFIEFHEGERMESTNTRRVWAQIKNKNVRKDYSKPVKIDGEYVQAFCGTTENYHVQNLFSDDISTRAWEKRRAAMAAGMAAETPSVVMLIIDSLSRAHFIRRLPKTIKMMETLDASKGGNYNVFQYFRYHSISHATPGNMRPLLASLTTNESRFGDISKEQVAESLLWKKFSDVGYVTSWTNDLCQDYFHMYFNMSSSYTDHEAVLPFCHYDYARRSGTFSNFKGGPYSIEKRCISGKYVHSYVFDYVYGLFDNYNDLPKFAVSCVSDAHESSGAVISTVDDEMAEFLKRITTDHPNTVILFVSDHGLHMGPYAPSPAGKVENVLPSHFAIYPSHLFDKVPKAKENMIANQQKLTTHFDLHKTLVNILDIVGAKGGNDAYDTKVTSSYAAKSMFDEISSTRSCKDAGIPDRYCICTNG